MNTITCKVTPSNIFNIEKAGSINPFLSSRYDINWNTKDNYELSEMLAKQVYNEYMDLCIINELCNNENEHEMYVIGGLKNGKPSYFRSYDIKSSQKREGSIKFLQWHRDYLEVFSRDHDAFTQKNFNVELYAVILLMDNMYQGHIYTWLSPQDNNYSFAMGIRNRVDSIFTKYTGEKCNNVSKYLLEGVTPFGNENGATNIMVVHPKPIMKQLLPSLGFEKTEISGRIIGNGITPFSIICTNCYILRK